MAPIKTEIVLEMHQVVTRFGSHVVHNGITLAVRRAEIFAVIGGSGSGKSTLLREMILLHTPNSGSVRVLGVDLAHITEAAALALRQRFGVLFQQGGLFGSLTVLENIGLPLREHRQLDDQQVDAIAAEKLALVGLAANVAGQYPSELSGGMMKRAALARALVLAPELLFLDELKLTPFHGHFPTERKSPKCQNQNLPTRKPFATKWSNWCAAVASPMNCPRNLAATPPAS